MVKNVGCVTAACRYEKCGIENAEVEHTKGTKDRIQYNSKREPKHKTSASTKKEQCVLVLAA